MALLGKLVLVARDTVGLVVVRDKLFASYVLLAASAQETVSMISCLLVSHTFRLDDL